MIKILCFGTFDGVHDGHRAMLRQAKGLGGFLVIAIAPDKIVQALKGDPPHYSSGERISLVKNERIADEVLLADETVGSWKILKKVRPNIIALGYDQDELKSSLEEYLERVYPDHSSQDDEGFKKTPKRPTIVVLSAHEPERLHTRLLRS